MAKSPQAQHAEHAKKILARRAKKEAKATEVTNDKEAPVPAGDMQDDPNPDYATWEKKDLKKECDRLGIEYHKKATNSKLIDLLHQARDGASA